MMSFRFYRPVTRRQSGSWYGVFGSLIMVLVLEGCASVPVALSLASLTAVGIGYTVVADESVIDALVSIGEKKDCNAMRMGRDGGPYCRPLSTGTNLPPHSFIDGASNPIWCYRSLGGLDCYTNPLPDRVAENLVSYGYTQANEPVSQDASQQTNAPGPRQDLQLSQTQPVAPKEVRTSGLKVPNSGDFLISRSVPELGIQGEALQPLPDAAQAPRAEFHGGLASTLPGGFTPPVSGLVPAGALEQSGTPGQQRQNRIQPGTENVRRGILPEQADRSLPLWLQQQNQIAPQPGTRQNSNPHGDRFSVNSYRDGGLPGPENGIVLGEPYSDYNPSWIRSFPNSYRQPGQNTQPFLDRNLPGLTP